MDFRSTGYTLAFSGFTMNYKNITFLVISLFILGILGYDCFVYIKAGQSATVSNVIIELSHDYPSGVFAIGFVMGHLFWQLKKQTPTQPE